MGKKEEIMYLCMREEGRESKRERERVRDRKRIKEREGRGRKELDSVSV